MQVTFTTVADFGLKPAAELLTRAFADYFVKIPFTEAGLWQMARADSVSFGDSLVVQHGGEAVGVAIVARRGWTSRLAGMALVPEARRRGLGRALVERWIADARARGDRELVLEVIEQNVAAVKLYEATGFQKVRRLIGFSGVAPAGLMADPELREVDLRAVAAAVTRHEAVNWPWQMSGETIAQLTPPHIGYTLDGAWLALLNSAGPQAAVRALVMDGAAQREERAVRLLRAVMARHPVDSWRVSAQWPEELGGCFIAAGLTRQELTQWQMGQSL
jgi:ribosomal protein S18 acetylase RimI-like enzyme